MQNIANKNSCEQHLPQPHVREETQEDSFTPSEEEEVSGHLIVDGPGQGEVCLWRYVWRETREVKRWGGEGYVGTEDGAERFEVEEDEAVDEGNIGRRH